MWLHEVTTPHVNCVELNWVLFWLIGRMLHKQGGPPLQRQEKPAREGRDHPALPESWIAMVVNGHARWVLVVGICLFQGLSGTVGMQFFAPS